MLFGAGGRAGRLRAPLRPPARLPRQPAGADRQRRLAAAPARRAGRGDLGGLAAARPPRGEVRRRVAGDGARPDRAGGRDLAPARPGHLGDPRRRAPLPHVQGALLADAGPGGGARARLGDQADPRRWAKVRDEIRDRRAARGLERAHGAFTGAFGSAELDASVLLCRWWGSCRPPTRGCARPSRRSSASWAPRTAWSAAGTPTRRASCPARSGWWSAWRWPASGTGPRRSSSGCSGTPTTSACSASRSTRAPARSSATRRRRCRTSAWSTPPGA